MSRYPLRTFVSAALFLAALTLPGCADMKSGTSEHRSDGAGESTGADATGGTRSPATDSGTPTPVTDATFDQVVLKADKPVLVDFWAPWCGPCRALAPVIEEIASEYKGKLIVAKLNTDENPSTAQTYKIRGIPSLYLFKNGQLVEQVIGAVPKNRLTDVINKHL